MLNALTNWLPPQSWTNDRLRRFAEILPCMLYEYVLKADGSSEFLFVGSKCQELLGLDENELLADANLFWNLVLEEDLQRLKSEDFSANTEGISFSSEVRIQTKSGRLKWIQLSSRPNPASVGEIVVWSGFMLDITERKQMEEQIRQLAFHDTLTNLPNRRLLMDRLAQGLAAGKRTGRYGALLFLDLDNFKALNDTRGHEAGDSLLIEVARRLTSSVREVDTVSRFGGDEFAVLLGDLLADKAESTKEVGIISEKIRVKLAEPYLLAIRHKGNKVSTVEHRCSASIGAVVFLKHECSQEDILRWTDTAMYQAKDAGRNTVVLHDASNEV